MISINYVKYKNFKRKIKIIWVYYFKGIKNVRRIDYE